MNPKFSVTQGGRGLAHAEVRDHQFVVLEELATRYQVDGIELDFAAAPGGMPPLLRSEAARELAEAEQAKERDMTVERVTDLLRGRKVFDLGVELFPGMPHVPTHSPFMIDGQHLDGLRTVEDMSDGETVLGTKVGDRVLSTDPDTVFPIRAALAYDVARRVVTGPSSSGCFSPAMEDGDQERPLWTRMPKDEFKRMPRKGSVLYRTGRVERLRTSLFPMSFRVGCNKGSIWRGH
jgi:hypothetical protein